GPPGKGSGVSPARSQRHIAVLFGQAGGALGAQHIQGGHHGGADAGRVAGRVRRAGCHSGVCAAHIFGVGGGPDVGGRGDVVGGADLLRVQDRDGGGGLQRGHHAAADGDLPVGGGQGGVDGAHGLACQQADPGGGGVGVGAGQAGRLPDAAGDVVG